MKMLSGLLFLAPLILSAQTGTDSLGLDISAYLESYYSKDDNRFEDHERPEFLYNNTRTDELAINLAFIRGYWQQPKMRLCTALMTGTYAGRNLSTESPAFRNIYEAWGGVALTDSRRLWMDAGIFPSHIGMESAMGMLNPTVSRSLAAENSPYYESGLRLTWKDLSNRWTLALLALNGWQRISKLPGRYGPAAGIQATYSPGPNLLVNYSNYIGDIDPAQDFSARIFQNLYATWLPTPKLNFAGSFDFGIQPRFAQGQDALSEWYAWYAIIRYAPHPKFAVTFRYENYTDEHETIVNNSVGQGFNVRGMSMNVDYAINSGTMLRLEYRGLFSDGAFYRNEKGYGDSSLNGLNLSFSIFLQKHMK